MYFNSSGGQTGIRLLLVIVLIGLIGYLLIANSFSFQDRILNIVYYKTPSQAFDSVELPPLNTDKSGTKLWEENWNLNTLVNWNKVNYNCNAMEQQNKLIVDCQSRSLLVNKHNWEMNSSIIINGGFSVDLVEGSPFSVGVGLWSSNNQRSIASIVANSSRLSESQDLVLDNYEGQPQKFRLVYTKIDGKQFVYYYLGEGSKPAKKVEIKEEGNFTVVLSCWGKCTFSPLTISGLKAD